MKCIMIKPSKPIKRREAWISLFAGLLVGTVFLFGMPYWQGSVDKSEALRVSGSFNGYEIAYTERHRNIKCVTLFFSNRDKLEIDGSCVNTVLLNHLDSIKAGTQVNMLLHPRSSDVMELSMEEEIVLDFNFSRKHMAGETKGFMILGAFLYFVSGICAVKLARGNVQ